MQSHGDFLRDLEENENGHFLIDHQNGRAFLRVIPPGKKGRPVALKDVTARLELFQLEGYDPLHVEEIVENADGEAHDICAWKLPDAVDARLTVDVHEDEMQAHLTVEPPQHGGRAVDRAMIAAALTEAGVVHGIDEEIVAALDDGSYAVPEAQTRRRDPESAAPRNYPSLSSKEKKLTVLIASGTRPAAGRSGRIVHRYALRPRAVPARPSIDEERVDFRKLNVIQTCDAGDLLASVEPPAAGSSGRTVTGRELAPRSGESAELVAGKNTRLDTGTGDAGRALYAEMAGQVRITVESGGRRARIDVEEILELDAVDYSTGHIDFPGTVRVGGTVLDGFEVRATGDILVEKTIGNVHLRAGGDIILAGGADRKGEGAIEAEGAVYARFVQDAFLYAGSDVLIEEAAINANVSAGRDIVLEGGRGELIGGNSLAGRSIRASKIGARAETPTFLTVGVSPDTMAKIRELDREHVEKQATLRRVERHLLQIDEARKRGREPDEAEQEAEPKLRHILATYTEIIANLEDQRRLLSANTTPNPAAGVEARDIVYPGVEVHFGAGVRRYRIEGLPVNRYTRFVLEDGRIHMRHSDI